MGENPAYGEAPAGIDRTPPQDLAAEQSVLGAMLMSKDAIADVVEVVKGRDFYRPAHELIYDAMLDLYGRGEPVDPITVADELGKRGDLDKVGGALYLHDLLASVAVAANAGYYSEIVRDKAVLRRLVEASIKVAQLGYQGQGDVTDIVDAAQQAIYEVSEGKTSDDYLPLSVLIEPTIDEMEAIGNRGGVMSGVPTGFAELDELTNGLHAGQMIIIAARPAMGKALALDTPLPTPTGWTTMGEVQVGDELLDANGRPTRVVAATEVMHDRPCFEITFSDGTRVVADAEHQWKATSRAQRRAGEQRQTRHVADAQSMDRLRRIAARPEVLPTQPLPFPVIRDMVGAPFTSALRKVAATAGASGTAIKPVLGPSRCYAWHTPGYDSSTLIPMLWERVSKPLGHATGRHHPQSYTTREMAKEVRLRDGRSNWAVPVAAPLELPERALEIDPYALGVWLGDGRSASARFTSVDPEIAVRLEARGCTLTRQSWFNHGLLRSGKSSVQSALRQLGLLGHKHIPAHYLRASREQRLELLRGLMDTDGTVMPQGSLQLVLTNAELAEDAYELIVGLGIRCGRATRHVAGRTESTSTAHILNFTTSTEVFSLPRKLEAQRSRSRTPASLTDRYIVSITPVESVPVRCVQVDNDDHLYLCTESMVPTHNSTLALDFARAAAIKHHLTTAFFSLEMSKTEIVMRLLSAEAQVALNHIRGGKMTEEDWSRVVRKTAQVSEAPFFIDDSPNLTMMEIRAKARRLKQRHDLKLVIIDYMQLMTSGKKVESRQLEVSEFSRQIKLLAKELEIPVIALSQLNRGPEQRTDKKPMLSDLRESGCLTAATRVLRADTGAEVSMGELLASDARDVPVWSLDEEHRLVPATMTHAFPSGIKDVYRLTLTSGRTVEATANHPFLTYDGWAALGELEPGTRLAIPRSVPEPLQTKPMDEDEVVLLAHLLGDGSFVARQPIRYASIDEHNMQAVAGAALRRFGITAVRDEYAAARVATLRLPVPYRLTHGRRNPIAAWLDELGLFDKRSHEKFVPDCVFQAPREQVCQFLRHIWATNGSVRWDARAKQGRIYYASTSRRLVDDLARLLLRVGIVGRIETVQKAGYRDGYHLVINSAPQQLTFCREIGVHGERGKRAVEVLDHLEGVVTNTNLDTIPVQVWGEVRELIKERGLTHREFAAAMQTQFCGSTLWKHAPSRERLGRVATVLEAPRLTSLALSEVFWDEVRSIEHIGTQEVYDATVLGTHNFVADGIVVHNSLEQDADMVILLNRDDVYDKESSRAGEADLIVAKHRNGPTATIVTAFQGHYSRFVDMQH